MLPLDLSASALARSRLCAAVVEEAPQPRRGPATVARARLGSVLGSSGAASGSVGAVSVLGRLHLHRLRGIFVWVVVALAHARVLALALAPAAVITGLGSLGREREPLRECRPRRLPPLPSATAAALP